MYKTLACLIFFVGVNPPAIAQELSDNTPIDLHLDIQQGKPDTNRIRLLHSVGQKYLSKKDRFENTQKTMLDSAITIFKEALRLSDSLGIVHLRNESMCLLGEAYFDNGIETEGRKYFMNVIKSYQTIGNKEKEAITWQRMGMEIPWEKINYELKLYALNKAYELFAQLNIPDKKANVLTKIGYIHFDEGKINIAETELLQALDVYKKIGHKDLYYTYHILSLINRYKGAFDIAHSYALECVTYAEKYNDQREIANAYGELALVYDELGLMSESIVWYQKALELRERMGESNVVIYRTAGFLIQQLILLKKENDATVIMSDLVLRFPPVTALEKATIAQNMGYCLEAQGKFSAAEIAYLEMIKQYENTNYWDEFKTIAKEDIGRFYLKQKKYEKAQFYLNGAISNLGTNPLSMVKDIYLLLFQADSAMGNYISAIRNFQHYKTLNDSIFNDKKNKQIEELQIKYQTSKRENDIELLNIQNKAQQNRLQSSAIIRNLIVLGSLCLLGLLYYRYNLKQRTTRKLEKQQAEISKKNIALQHLIKEKEWLVKEIHHRVKNNFQIIIGLLRTQSSYLKNKDALVAINESQRRIQVMSLIHQKLYQSDNLSVINMNDYIHELVDYLKFSFGNLPKIRFKLELEDVVLGFPYAIPLGLILNEAITNSIKYAFPGNMEGSIVISLQHISNGNLQLLISDNGLGVPEDINIHLPGSMGMNLMKGLSDDIDGVFSINMTKGTEVSIVFSGALDSIHSSSHSY